MWLVRCFHPLQIYRAVVVMLFVSSCLFLFYLYCFPMSSVHTTIFATAIYAPNLEWFRSYEGWMPHSNSTVGGALSHYNFNITSSVQLTSEQLSVQANLCDPQASILLAVLSKPNDFDERRRIRTSWGQCAASRGTPFRLGFFIGGTPNSTKNDSFTATLLEEKHLYHDVVQDTSYLDHYNNLTTKVISIMRWTGNFCPSAKILLKVDSDAIVLLDRLITWLRQRIPDVSKSVLFGNQLGGGRVIRNQHNKWFVPVEEFSRSYFASYLAGPVYGMTRSAMEELLRRHENYVLLNGHSVRIEDAYITGVLYHTNHVNSIERLNEPLMCTMSCHKKPASKVIAAHELFASNIKWRDAYLKELQSCSQIMTAFAK